MTSIEQLQICGVRSFDPNPANKQTVLFQKPLTVILGKNGAGKTTIIEALLNACTGAMPPGSGSEKSSFVYDPKVIGESEVKAQIRLIFTGKGGKIMQVIRSFQVTRTRNRTTFATLDNTVAFHDEASGKVVSSTYRASDVDRVVPEMLGVSPAVLQHVIFCHQEDGNWPLAPPKDVKRIFDDIFAATRYVLALDRLRDNAKELRRQQKEHEASLLALREHREQAAQLETDIAAKEEAVRTIQRRSTTIEPELRELRRVSAELDGVEQHIESLDRESALIQGRVGEKREALRRANVPPPTQSLEALLALRDGFDRHVRQAEAEAARRAEQRQAAEAEARAAEEAVYHARAQLQLQEREAQQHAHRCAALRALLARVAPAAEVHVGEGQADERSLQRVLESAVAAVAAARRGQQEAATNARAQLAAEESRRQEALRERDASAKEREVLQARLDALAARTAEIDAALRAPEAVGAAAQRAALEETLAALAQRVEAAAALREKGEHHQRRARLLAELEANNAEVVALRRAMQQAKALSGGEAEGRLLRQQLDEREAALAVAMAALAAGPMRECGLEASGDGDSDSDGTSGSPSSPAAVAARVEPRRQRAEEEAAAAAQEAARAERQLAVVEQRAAHRQEQLVAAEAEAAALARTLPADAVAALEDYETRVEAARAEAAARRARCHALTARAVCHDEFLAVASRDGKCAVCDRPFASDDERRAFEVHSRAAGLEATPAARAEAEQAAADGEVALAALEAQRHAVHDLRQLRARLPAQRAAAEATAAEVAEARQQLAAVAARRAAAEAALGPLQALGRRLEALRAAEGEAAALRARLARHEERVRGARAAAAAPVDPRGEDELTAAYEAATAAWQRLNAQLQEAQRMEDGASDGAAERELHVRRAEAHALDLALARLEDLRRERQRGEEEAAPMRARVAAIDRRAAELTTILGAIDGAMAAAHDAQRVAEAQHQAAVAAAEHSQRELEQAVPPVLQHIKSGAAARLEATRAELQRGEAAAAKAAEEMAALGRAIAESRRVVEEQHRQGATMEQQISVLETEQAIAADTARLSAIEASLRDLKGGKLRGVEQLLGAEASSEPLPRLRERIRLKMSELEKVSAQQAGSVEAMLHDVNNLKSQLAREKYQNVEKRYRSTFLKVQTTAIAVKDIEKYYVALEKAVQSYHLEKIAQINQIIADLWRQTYRGSDIDTVEIRSETENTSTAARRSYNYRVVMMRGDSEIDMRGRCSAGQKVLASVIIRLALSEAFCCDCGILALDEPTTNLDEDNARSLAVALRSLIEARRNVRHFQLVVITHDEQFVRALGGQSLDRFYYVHKDREGAFSVIDERTFDQLFA